MDNPETSSTLPQDTEPRQTKQNHIKKLKRLATQTRLTEAGDDPMCSRRTDSSCFI